MLDVERWTELRREHFVRGVGVREPARRGALAQPVRRPRSARVSAPAAAVEARPVQGRGPPPAARVPAPAGRARQGADRAARLPGRPDDRRRVPARAAAAVCAPADLPAHALRPLPGSCASSTSGVRASQSPSVTGRRARATSSAAASAARAPARARSSSQRRRCTPATGARATPSPPSGRLLRVGWLFCAAEDPQEHVAATGVTPLTPTTGEPPRSGRRHGRRRGASRSTPACAHGLCAAVLRAAEASAE